MNSYDLLDPGALLASFFPDGPGKKIVDISSSNDMDFFSAY